ncbi:exodeoxyribonuclease VII small subunit [Cronobacter muytjensii]|nr:exodeoxyribonuclease VII small subunit [Cronobacter muytjensii]
MKCWDDVARNVKVPDFVLSQLRSLAANYIHPNCYEAQMVRDILHRAENGQLSMDELLPLYKYFP